LAALYIFQSVSAFTSLIRYRKLHNERLELGTLLHSTEGILAKLLEYSSHERHRLSDTTEEEYNENERRILWLQYDSALVDFLYRTRKPA